MEKKSSKKRYAIFVYLPEDVFMKIQNLSKTMLISKGTIVRALIIRSLDILEKDPNQISPLFSKVKNEKEKE